MGRRLGTILLMTMALSAVGAVMTASGALADPKTATFTIQLSGAAEVCPTAPGTCGGPGTGTATITIDRNARTLCYAITTQNVALPLLAAHIHEAPVGEAGRPDRRSPTHHEAIGNTARVAAARAAAEGTVGGRVWDHDGAALLAAGYAFHAGRRGRRPWPPASAP
jgi:predicted aconitase with swiveling domain